MADPAPRLAELRQLDSRTKAARVSAALDAMVVSGTVLSIAALARNAGVSRRFIYDHPELGAEAERRSAQIIERQSAAVTTTARVTAASLRADLADVNTTNHRLNYRARRSASPARTATRPRSARRPARRHRHRRHPPDRSTRSHLLAAQEQLAIRTGELAAARQINRELLGRVNRQGRW